MQNVRHRQPAVAGACRGELFLDGGTVLTQGSGDGMGLTTREELVLALNRLGSPEVVHFDATTDPPSADGEYVPIYLGFSDHMSVSSAYWRLLRAGRVACSSFDHGKSLGQIKLDAVAQLRDATMGKICRSIELDGRADDLSLYFDGDVCLIAFGFRALFEDWEIRLPSGLSYWSNQLDF